MRVLAIETSCDETAIAIADFLGAKQKPRIKVLSHLVSSQIKLHARFGGVVPNLAKREHQKNLVPLLVTALKQAGAFKSKVKSQKSKVKSKVKKLEEIFERESDLLKHFKRHILPLEPPPIDAIAVTYGPGLEPALWVGVNFARALAYLWEKPVMPVNHMAGHLYSALLNDTQKTRPRKMCTISGVRFPALALLVSGGHTQLVLMRGHKKYQLLGETRDDAAGEAFDKVARLLGLGYPGGPAISALAEAKIKNTNQKLKLSLPKPMLHSKDYDFSFSGLKTAVLYHLKQFKGGSTSIKLKREVAASFEEAAVEVLVKKTIRAAKEYKVKTILLGGGVAANKKLRHDLGEAVARELPRSTLHIPHSTLTGDNALMIAFASFFTGRKTGWRDVRARANASL